MVASKISDIPEWKSKYCPCKGCGTAREEGRQEIIKIVTKILKEVTADKGETGLSRSEHLVVVALAERIYQALDGER